MRNAKKIVIGVLGGGGGDTTAPTVTITCAQSSPTSTSPLNFTFTCSEDSTDFDIDSIAAGNATKGNFAGSGSVYTCDLTPTVDGPVTADVAANAFHDAAGNGNTAATQFSITAANVMENYISSLSPGFWLQANYDQNAAYVDGNAVSPGYDASANQLDVTQGTAGSKPTYKTNILNGLPVFRFDGGDSLARANVTGSQLIGNAQGTVFLAMKQLGTQAQNGLFGFGASSNKFQSLLTYENVLYFDLGNQTPGQGRISGNQPDGWDDAWHIVELQRNADNSGAIMVDGTNVATGNFTANFNGAVTDTFSISNITFAGDLFLLVTFPTALSDAQRLNLRNKLKDKTGLLTLSLSAPAANKVIQRSGTTGSISISGSILTLTPRTIEASFNGGDYADIATGVTDAFSGALAAQTAGQGTLTVRIKGTAVTSTVANISLGDVFICAGQSNMSGRGTNNQSYSHATLEAYNFTNAYTWAELADPYDGTSGQLDTVSEDGSPAAAGSFIPLLATAYMADQSAPIAFVPCAKGGTAIAAWLPGANHQDRTTLYGSMIYRALQTGCKAVLWWQGESDVLAGTAEATYNANLDTLANAVYADLGVKLVVCKLQDLSGVTPPLDESTINSAINTAWGDNANVLTGPDLSDLTPSSADGYHFLTDEELVTVSGRWWTAIQTAFGW